MVPSASYQPWNTHGKLLREPSVTSVTQGRKVFRYNLPLGMQGGRDLPAQGTIRLSTEAYKVLAHRAIDAELRLNQLLDAIILHTDWEKDLPALVTGIKEHRTAPEKVLKAISEESSQKPVENIVIPKSATRTLKMSQEPVERPKTQESLGKFALEEETHHAEPS